MNIPAPIPEKYRAGKSGDVGNKPQVWMALRIIHIQLVQVSGTTSINTARVWKAPTFDPYPAPGVWKLNAWRRGKFFLVRKGGSHKHRFRR